MSSRENLDKKICEVEKESENTQTYREFIRESENEFGLERENLEVMNDFDLFDYIEKLDYLWTK